MKKRTIIVVALAIVLALSFATIATAKYAGAFRFGGLVAGDSTTGGYLTWGDSTTGAQSLNAANNNGLAETAHGGYVTSSTKCAVCHSAHRAYASTATGTGGSSITDRHLTAGANACLVCHAAYNAGGSNKKIEWTQGSSNPHGNGCTNRCHQGGVHGDSGSAYHAMNVWLLGNTRDARITTAFENGNLNSNISYNDASGTTLAHGWFQNGVTTNPASGEKPAGLTDVQFAAAKATATGYTCSASTSSCHSNSHFAVNTWGYAEEVDGFDGTSTSSSGKVAATGHGTGAWGHDGGSPSCYPCHPGGLAGNFRMADTLSVNTKALAFGCDQCHDMVGVLTGSTSWPHGNRTSVYEWGDDFTPTDTASVDGLKGSTASFTGNLWMYSYDIGVLADSNAASGTTWSPVSGTQTAASTTGERATAAANWNTEFKVIASANFASATTPIASTTNAATAKPGTIVDGSCLKCHVPVDEASKVARGGTATSPINPGTTRAHHYLINPVGDIAVDSASSYTWATSGTVDQMGTSVTGTYSGSKLIFLFK